MEANDINNKPFLSGVAMQVVVKYRKHLLIIGALAILLSAIFSSPFFITPLYKSTVILYPTASKSISKVLLSDNPGISKDILEFGEEEQTEQMLQVLNSNKIRDKIIDKYNLLEHYKIPENSSYKFTRLFDEYESKFEFRRTEFMAVKITVYDSDAQLAADMANSVAELIDSTINQMQKEVAIKAFHIVEREYNSLKQSVQDKEDSLDILRSYGVNDYESQAEMFNRQLAIEMARGNTDGMRRLEQKLTVIAKYGGTYVSLRDGLEHDKKQLSAIKAKYDEAKVDASETLPHKFVVSNAYKAEKKSYPIRWLIVLISTLSVIFLSIVAFGLMEVWGGGISLDIKKKSRILKPRGEQVIFKETKIEIKPKVAKNKEPEKELNTLNTKVEEKKTDKKDEENKGNNNYTKENIQFEMEKYFNSFNLLKLIVKWKYHLLVIVGASALLATIFSGPFFITPMFKSVAIAYPANIEPFSDESESEQMLQVLNSHEIMDSVIKKFNLAKHYDIDVNYPYFQTIMYYKYKQNVSISKTSYESVMIEVQDKNPDTAAKMADAILGFYDKKIASMHKSKYREVLEMYSNQMLNKQKSLDSLKSVLSVLGKDYGIFEYDYQSQEIMRAFLKTGNGSGQANPKEVEKLLNSMEEKSGQLIEVVQMIQNEAIAYVELKQDYEMTQRFINSRMTYSNIVAKPFPADKKSYPVRWLIVLVVSLASFAFAMLTILFIENRKFSLEPEK
jgi:capsular polysaccharide biosynthesis protein